MPSARHASRVLRTIGISARVRGLLAGGERGLVLLEQAVPAHEASPARLERAYSLLELGAALRRAAVAGTRCSRCARRWSSGGVAARPCSRLARSTSWAWRARSDAATRSGRRRADAERAPGRADGRRGMRNREIAEGLFVTAKTVENHLGRVYSKLGINSRGELNDALGGAMASAG